MYEENTSKATKISNLLLINLYGLFFMTLNIIYAKKISKTTKFIITVLSFIGAPTNMLYANKIMHNMSINNFDLDSFIFLLYGYYFMTNNTINSLINLGI